MPFRSGSVSYARFQVSGASMSAPTTVDDALLEQLAAHVVRAPEIGVPPEVHAGWCAGRHVLDEGFDWETCGFGSALLAGIRIDVNRVPAELRRAYVAMAEGEHAARALPSGGGGQAGGGHERGFLGRAEKRAARDEADRRCNEELASGRHRRSSMVPLLWDIPRGAVLAPLNGERSRTQARDLFAASLQLGLHGRSAGSLAWDLLSVHGLAGELDDLRPASFTPAPAQRSGDGERRIGAVPEVPWAAAGTEAKDFVGNEFLLWLWWTVETREGLVETSEGEVALVVERVIDLDCAWGVTGKTSLRGDAPTLLPEAAKALLHGKWPRRAGILLAATNGHGGHGGSSWSFTLQADKFAVSGVSLPDIDDARSEREVVEQRVERLLEFDRALLATFEVFLRQRVGREWPTLREQISEWIRRRAAARAAA